MKAIHAIYILIVFATATTVATAQDYPEEYLGLPGDNLNLYAVMNLFQESETLEKFEQNLNSEESMINNLDLNGDKLIDYITVSDYVDGNVHNIVLRAALNQSEQQDVAVFVVEKLRNGAVEIQLIGDEALYGPNYIVEPIYAETPNPGYTGRIYRSHVNVVTTSYYDIAAWPVIRFIYHPGYSVWRSSWYWGYYPAYWHPWRSHYWHYYYGYHYHWNDYYYTHYRHWDHFRCRSYHTYYHSHVRVFSPTVVVNINKGQYRSTYSRPDRRHAGETYYAQTAIRRGNANSAGVYRGHTGSRSATVANRQRVQRTATPSNRTRSTVSTTGQRTSRKSTPSVQRSSSSRSSTVQRSQPGNSRSPVHRNSSKNTTPYVQRSSNRSSKGSAVQQSQPSRSRSSVNRNQPNRSRSTVQRNYTTNRKSTPSVQHSSSSRSKSSTVKRSQPSKSRSPVQRSSSSRKSGDSRSSSSSSRRR